ncbi:MAG TPA: hypothetical protein VI894_00430 [Candidatus Nanoarchaeia archaeon]|nr:hypothetical protein [Candidatus Nanoarchaeia archaeon]
MMAFDFILLITGLAVPIIVALFFIIPLFGTLDKIEGVSYANVINTIRIFSVIAILLMAYFWWRIFYALRPFVFEDLGVWIDLIVIILISIKFMFVFSLMDQIQEIERKAYK